MGSGQLGPLTPVTGAVVVVILAVGVRLLGCDPIEDGPEQRDIGAAEDLDGANHSLTRCPIPTNHEADAVHTTGNEQGLADPQHWS